MDLLLVKKILNFVDIASIKSDYKILLQAKTDSDEYLKNTPDNDNLKKMLISSIEKA